MMQSNSSDNCVHHYNIDILNFFDPELQLTNIKPMVRDKLKELLSELKKYKKTTDCKIFYSSAKLIASDSDIDEAFESMYQSIMMKIKNSASEDWTVIELILKHSIKFLSVHRKMEIICSL